MKKFDIYHLLPFYTDRNVVVAQRQFVLSVEAPSLDSAFLRTQNHFDLDYALREMRSTTIGDAIYDPLEDKLYLVKEQSFEEIDKSLINYVDWGVNMNLIHEDIKLLPNSIKG